MSTAYVPKVLLPDWLQSAVDYNPSEYLIRAVRGIFLEGFTDSTLDSISIAVLYYSSYCHNKHIITEQLQIDRLMVRPPGFEPGTCR